MAVISLYIGLLCHAALLCTVLFCSPCLASTQNLSFDRPLKIAVPNRPREAFKQFVSWTANSSNDTTFHGFCIEVFQSALKYLPYTVPFTFLVYGQNSTPYFDDMIDQLANKMYDGVVGEFTITTKRMQKVDFTQPYTQSGLVVVVPTKDSHSKNAFIFLQPFKPTMWLVTLAFFIFTGLVVWMLEYNKNNVFRGGHPKEQVGNILWFSFSTLCFSQTERIKSAFGRLVVIIWLFVVLIITSSYTANLTSLLTVQQLTPTIQGLSTLQAENDPIGYRAGGFTKDHLISLGIAEGRLKPLSSEAAYAQALNSGPNRGGVSAIVDGILSVQSFWGTQCGFSVAGQEFTKDGWGFAFPKGSELAVDISTAILTMSQNGELQRLHDVWLTASQCSTDSSQVESNQLSLSSFWGLFLVTGLVSGGSLLIFAITLLWHRFAQQGASINNAASSRSWKARLTIFAASVVKSWTQMPDKKGSAHGEKKKRKRKKKKKKEEEEEEGEGEAVHHQLDEGSLHIINIEERRHLSSPTEMLAIV